MEVRSDLIVVRDFFLPGADAGTAKKELIALTKEDRAQLAAGIRDGSYDYN